MMNKLTSDKENTKPQDSINGFTLNNPQVIFNIAEVINTTMAVVNAGNNHGIKRGMYCIVYGEGQEIFDPNTGESLGLLELLRGRAVVTQVQEKMCVIKACKHRVKTAFIAVAFAMGERFEDDDIKFTNFEDDIFKGDLVKFSL